MRLVTALLAVAAFWLHMSEAIACPGLNQHIQVSSLAKKQWMTAGQHPLVGSVLSGDRPFHPEVRLSSCGEVTAWSMLSGTLSSILSGHHAVVILGEVHDNAEHHRFRAWLLHAMKHTLVGHSRPAVVIEQANAERQSEIEKYNSEFVGELRPAELGDLKLILDWENSGWKKYAYDPMLDAIGRLVLPIYAGDPTRETIRKVAKQGEGALPVEERSRLALDKPLGPALDEASLKEIEDAHCGMLPKSMLPNMAFAQRYRDAHLADAALKAADEHGSAVLFAGNGHARTDRGATWYIRQRDPARKVVSVMLIEVEEGKTDPEAYVPRDPDGRSAADYIIFTPRAERPDPCSQMPEKAK